jgi:hypothetical protein
MNSKPYMATAALTQEPQQTFQDDLADVLETISETLIAKNRKYGDAALNPVQTFSRVPPMELINVRMDDKLSRIRNRQNDEDEDPELDLLGYLILKQIAKKRATRKPT